MITDYPDQPREEADALAIGWTAFAAVALLLLALFNAVEGIAAISNSEFFANGALIVGDLGTWGWVLCGIAIAQLLAAPWVLMSAPVGRAVGVAAAAVDAVVQMLFMPAYPFWSLVIVALNILVVYGLVVHGARQVAR
jgi:hypothetical protein